MIPPLPGRKVDALRAKPIACLQVDEISSNVAWQSALAYGEYEEIKDSDERTRLFDAICDRFPYLTPVESNTGGEVREIIVFRIKITCITGVREG